MDTPNNTGKGGQDVTFRRGDLIVRRRPTRRGFTLLEVLGVISIMLILMSLAVIGFEHLDASASGKQTRVMLDDCTAMLNEYENAAGAGALTNLGEGGPSPSSGFPYPAGMGGPLGGSTMEITTMSDSNNADAYGRYGTAVQYTWYVMANLMRVPSVKAIVDKIPASRILTMPDPSTGNPIPYTPGTATSGAGVVLLDGWNNPIIFVPNGGIAVWKKAQLTATTISSRDMRPFFASAGQDGDFGADSYTGPLPAATATGSDSWTSSTMNGKPTRTPMGDDNIYSFENGQ